MASTHVLLVKQQLANKKREIANKVCLPFVALPILAMLYVDADKSLPLRNSSPACLLRRDVGTEGTWGERHLHPIDFGKSGNPFPNRGADWKPNQ